MALAYGILRPICVFFLLLVLAIAALFWPDKAIDAILNASRERDARDKGLL